MTRISPSDITTQAAYHPEPRCSGRGICRDRPRRSRRQIVPPSNPASRGHWTCQPSRLAKSIRWLDAGRRRPGLAATRPASRWMQPREYLQRPRGMSIQLDTSILTRLCRPNDPAHTTARNAVAKLQAVGQILEIVPQNLYEFWTVATRPVAGNGLGLTVDEAHAEILRLRALFPLRLDDPAIVDVWESWSAARLFARARSHNAPVFVAMRDAGGLQEILTFNKDDFARFPGIFVIDPATV